MTKLKICVSLQKKMFILTIQKIPLKTTFITIPVLLACSPSLDQHLIDQAIAFIADRKCNYAAIIDDQEDLEGPHSHDLEDRPTYISNYTSTETDIKKALFNGDMLTINDNDITYTIQILQTTNPPNKQPITVPDNVMEIVLPYFEIPDLMHLAQTCHKHSIRIRQSSDIWIQLLQTHHHIQYNHVLGTCYRLSAFSLYKGIYQSNRAALIIKKLRPILLEIADEHYNNNLDLVERVLVPINAKTRYSYIGTEISDELNFIDLSLKQQYVWTSACIRCFQYDPEAHYSDQYRPIVNNFIKFAGIAAKISGQFNVIPDIPESVSRKIAIISISTDLKNMSWLFTIDFPKNDMVDIARALPDGISNAPSTFNINDVSDICDFLQTMLVAPTKKGKVMRKVIRH